MNSIHNLTGRESSHKYNKNILKFHKSISWTKSKRIFSYEKCDYACHQNILIENRIK